MVTLVSYYSDNDRYDKLLEVSVNSFKHFHKNDDYKLVVSNKEDLLSFNSVKIVRTELLNIIPAGTLKFLSALKLCVELQIKKVIILGADTIVCSRLDEFLDDNNTDVLATLDYPYQIPLNFKNSNSENHVNADVVCFNNIELLGKVVNLSLNSNYFGGTGFYFEQGALNDLLFSDKHNVNFKIVDYPYSESKVVYNVRSKGDHLAITNTKPWKKYVDKYKVIDDKLIDSEGKQIKVFHYCEGFGNLKIEVFKNLLNWWIFECFNEETKQFFTKISNSDLFSKGV